ncbi:hypothetical protein [Luteolibacter sp. Populi]|uniref:hypothetical protein n=1 Tax=Luteolibacter sp. Populi TaxID=3230487 RepID=UPI00346718E1
MLWIPVLVASHVAAYFAMGGFRTEGSGTRQAGGGQEGVPTAKYRGRGEAWGGHARLLQGLAASQLTGEEYQRARTALLKDWVKRDLRGALKLFYAPETWGAFRSDSEESEMEALVREEMARQPLAVWEWIRSGTYGSNRGDVSNLWGAALIADGKSDLVLAAVPEASRGEQENLVGKLCKNAKAADLAQIRRLLDGPLADHPDREDMAIDYGQRRVVLADGNVTELFTGEEDPIVRDSLCDNWISRELPGLPPERIAERLAELPGDVLAGGFLELAGEDLRDGMPGVASLLDEMGRRSLWKEMGEDERAEAVGHMVEYAYEDYVDPSEMLGHFATISDPAVRGIALEKAGEAWGNSHSDGGLIEVLGTLPPGEQRDGFLAGVLLTMSGEDEEFETAMGMLENGELKERVVKELEKDPKVDGFHAEE